jgi:hypothetical protein
LGIVITQQNDYNKGRETYPKGDVKMAKYRVMFIEKIFYETYVEADNEDEAEKKAIELFDNGDDSVEVTNQYVDYMETEEEK